MIKREQTKSCLDYLYNEQTDSGNTATLVYNWGNGKKLTRLSRAILRLKFTDKPAPDTSKKANIQANIKENIQVKWGLTSATEAKQVVDVKSDLDYLCRADGVNDVYIDITKALSAALQSNSNLALRFITQNCWLDFGKKVADGELDTEIVLTTYYDSVFSKPNERMIKTFDFTGGKLAIDLAKCNEELSISAINGSGVFPINVNLMYDSLAHTNDGYCLCDSNRERKYKLNTKCGKGWKLNYQQYLYEEEFFFKTLSDASVQNPLFRRFTWVKEDGSQVVFNENFYVDNSKNKDYDFLLLWYDENLDLCSQKEFIVEHGTDVGPVLKNVKREIECEKDYTINAPIKGIPNCEYLKQDIDEIYQLKSQIKAYEENIDYIKPDSSGNFTREQKKTLKEYKIGLSQAKKKLAEYQKYIPEITIADKAGNVWGFKKSKEDKKYILIYLADANGNTQSLMYDDDENLTDIYSSEGGHVTIKYKDDKISEVSNDDGITVTLKIDDDLRSIDREKNTADSWKFFYQANKLKAFTSYDSIGYFLEHNSAKCQRVQKASLIPCNAVGCSQINLGGKTYYYDRHCSYQISHSNYVNILKDKYTGERTEVYYDDFGRITSVASGAYDLVDSNALNNCKYNYPNNYSLFSNGINYSTARNRQKEYITENKTITLPKKNNQENTQKYYLPQETVNAVKQSQGNCFVFSCRANANSFKVESQYLGLVTKYLNCDKESLELMKEIISATNARKFKASINFDFGGEIGAIEYDCLFDDRISGTQFSSTPISLYGYDLTALEGVSIKFDYSYNNGEAQFFDFSLRTGSWSFEEKNEEGFALKTLSSDKRHYYINEYDKDGRLTTVYEAMNTSDGDLDYQRVVLNKVYEENKLLKESDDKGNVVLYTYDENGRLTKKESYNEADPTSRFVQESRYDAETKVVTNYNEFGEPLGNVEYLKGRTVLSDTASGVKQVIGYDLTSGDLKSISAISEQTENQLVKTTNNNSVKYTHGECSYEAKTNMYGEAEEIKINGNGYCKITKDYDGEYTQTEYANGEIFKVNRDEYGMHYDHYYTDKNGNGGVYTYLEETYNSNGDITLVEDKENGVKHYFYYDEQDRPKTTVYNVWNGSVKTDYEYNSKNQLSQKKHTVSNSIVDTQNYTYDELGEKLEKVSHTAVGEECFKYDCLNRLSDYTKANGKIAEKLTYKKVGERTSNLLQSENLLLNGNHSLKLAYDYDTLGRITAVRENNALVCRYEYDAIGRLKREDNKVLDKTVVFEYDNSGNIVNRFVYSFTLASVEDLTPEVDSYSYTADRLNSYNGEACSYDVLGNPTVYRGKTATWSHVNRMDSFNGVRYTYDYAGIRTGKTVNGIITKYFYDGASLLVEDNGTRKLTYIYGSDGVTAFKLGNAVYYYLKNQLGDVYGLTDINGNIVARYVYDAWGNHKVLNPNGTENTSASFIGNVNPIRYRSYYFDTETGLYYLQSRYYDAETGRFITADNIAYLDFANVNGLNRYTYCGNNPVMNIDPSGHLALLLLAGLLLFTPIGGTVVQAIVSIASYIGIGIASIFDEDIRNDMDQIGWNLFNTDEAATLKSNKVSFYKGVPVFRTAAGNRSGSFGAIFLAKGSVADDLRHERGHNWQLMMMGVGTFFFTVAIPSIFKLGNWTPSPNSNDPYYNSPWETMADMLGGVKGRTHTQEEINRAWIYYILGHFIIPSVFYWF